MKASPVRALFAAAIALALAGCAQPQPVVTDAPVVTAPSDEAAPDAKPTAASGAPCFDAYTVSSADEQHGGELAWPEPLTDDSIGVEPSCWYDALDSEVNLFLAGWYGLDDAQYNMVTPRSRTRWSARATSSRTTRTVSHGGRWRSPRLRDSRSPGPTASTNSRSPSGTPRRERVAPRVRPRASPACVGAPASAGRHRRSRPR